VTLKPIVSYNYRVKEIWEQFE